MYISNGRTSIGAQKQPSCDLSYSVSRHMGEVSGFGKIILDSEEIKLNGDLKDWEV